MKVYLTQVIQQYFFTKKAFIVGSLAFFLGPFCSINLLYSQERTDWISYKMPTYFENPSEGLRAVGIARKGVYSDSLTYKQAFDRALESINANAGTWYFAEHFDNAFGSNFNSFYEFSIEQKIDGLDVIVTDTSSVNNWFFLEIAVKTTPNSDTTLTWVEAVGVSQMIWTNPYAAFEKAKQNAIKEIAYSTDLHIIGSQWASGGYSGDLFFIKSKVFFEGVEVVSRRLDNGKCLVHIRVPSKGVSTF